MASLLHQSCRFLVGRSLSFKMMGLRNVEHRLIEITKRNSPMLIQMCAKGGKRMKNVKTTMQLSDEEMMDVVDVSAYRSDLQSVVDKMKSDFVEHLMVRSAAGGIEKLLVEIEGEKFPLNELAQISRKNPNLVAVNMVGFPEGLKPALKAITESGLGLNPQQEGTMIYLPIPKVTREFREKLAKNAKMLYTKTRDTIRVTQNAYIKETKQKEDLSEDLTFSTQQQLTKIAEEYNADAEKLFKQKQKELLGET